MNCKPGDLAYIVHCDEQANVGAVVEVMETSVVDDIAWQRVQAKRPMIVIDDDRIPRPLSEGWIRDANLRPISGVPVTDDVRDEVTA